MSGTILAILLKTTNVLYIKPNCMNNLKKLAFSFLGLLFAYSLVIVSCTKEVDTPVFPDSTNKPYGEVLSITNEYGQGYRFSYRKEDNKVASVEYLDSTGSWHHTYSMEYGNTIRFERLDMNTWWTGYFNIDSITGLITGYDGGWVYSYDSLENLKSMEGPYKWMNYYFTYKDGNMSKVVYVDSTEPSKSWVDSIVYSNRPYHFAFDYFLNHEAGTLYPHTDQQWPYIAAFYAQGSFGNRNKNAVKKIYRTNASGTSTIELEYDETISRPTHYTVTNAHGTFNLDIDYL